MPNCNRHTTAPLTTHLVFVVFVLFLQIILLFSLQNINYVNCYERFIVGTMRSPYDKEKNEWRKCRQRGVTATKMKEKPSLTHRLFWFTSVLTVFLFFGFFPSSTNHRFFEVVELVELADPVFKTLIIFTTICHCCFSSAFLLWKAKVEMKRHIEILIKKTNELW
jgi:hypothetical protein